MEVLTYSAGGVIVNPRGEVAICNQKHNSWSLPKGHIDPGEDARTAAIREIKEETGLTDLEFVRELGTYERYRIGKDGVGDDTAEKKSITMFLFTTTERIKLIPEDPENPEARWVPIAEVTALLTHPKDKEFFESVAASLSLK